MPRAAVHPGKALQNQLQAIGVKPSEFARQIDVPANRISQIINGKRAITGDTALRLAHWFKNAPDYWLSLQLTFDLHVAQQILGCSIKSLPTRPDEPDAMMVSPSRQAQRRAHGSGQRA